MIHLNEAIQLSASFFALKKSLRETGNRWPHWNMMENFQGYFEKFQIERDFDREQRAASGLERL